MEVGWFVLRIISHTIYRKMLYVIGLGLNDEKDITVRGLEVGSRHDAC
jgi:hypothetical protein